MFLEYLPEYITLESLMEDVKGLEVDAPEENDYDPGLWPGMKSKRFISTYEKIKGHEGLWQLSFNHGSLYLIQFNIEFGSRSENAYNNCMDVCKTIIKINNSIRGMKDQLAESYRRTFMEFKSETMSDSGIPIGHYVQFADYRWHCGLKSATLSAGCTWPDSMSVEYREQQL
jgi:hypothetical protein